MKSDTTILQLCPRLNSGGIERGTIDMAIAVANAGINSIVASNGGLLVDQLNAAGVKHITLPLHQKSPLAILRNSRRLRKLIIENNVNLVHARSRAPIWTALRALKKLSIPLVTGAHSPHSSGFLNLKKIYNACIARGDKVIAISNFIHDYLEKQYHLPSDKIEIVYRGIDCEQFNRKHYSADGILKIKQKYRIPANKTIILVPGRITRWKGQDTLIEALHRLNDKRYHAIFVGRVDSQTFYQQCKELCTRYQLNDQVQWLPESNNIADFYAVADITLSTSRKAEAFGRVAVEAQAMRSLVIATELGAVAETIIPQQTGFTIPPDNPDALAHTLQQCSQLTKAQKVIIQDQARQRVEQQFSKRQMLANTLELYNALAKTDNII